MRQPGETSTLLSADIVKSLATLASTLTRIGRMLQSRKNVVKKVVRNPRHLDESAKLRTFRIHSMDEKCNIYILNDPRHQVETTRQSSCMFDRRVSHLSSDGGAHWRPILEKENVVTIHPNPHFHDWMYFVTSDQKVYYT